ncbi:MAG: hypothetical protein Q4E06_07435 [Lautropia sp.]|nr:hypothetical protein [Lautropia sp.]
MSLAGYRRPGAQPEAKRISVNAWDSLADEVAEAIEIFDAEERLKQQPVPVALSDEVRVEARNRINPDLPVFVLSRAWIRLVTNLSVLALVAGAYAGVSNDRALAIFERAFPTLRASLRWAGVHSASALIDFFSMGLTLVGLLFAVSMAFSCFQDVSSLIRHRWLQILFWVVSTNIILVVAVVLMAFVIGLSP